MKRHGTEPLLIRLVLRACLSLVVFGTVPHLVGCATILQGSNPTIKVDSEPKGADVYINGDLRGVTPFEMKLALQDEPMNLEVQLEGYRNESAVFRKKWQPGWLLLDLVGGVFFFPFDWASGAWYSYSPRRFQFELQPMKQPSAPTEDLVYGGAIVR